jgi:ribosomal protein L44E
LDLPLKTPNLIARKKEEKSSLEEGQRQARRQQQQLLRNFSTPSKKSTPTRTLSEFTSVRKSFSKSVYSDPTK